MLIAKEFLLPAVLTEQQSHTLSSALFFSRGCFLYPRLTPAQILKLIGRSWFPVFTQTPPDAKRPHSDVTPPAEAQINKEATGMGLNA